MNNTVITYYTEIPDFKTSSNNKALLELWEKNWKSKGWNTIVLSDRDSKKHKDICYFDVGNENSLLVRNSRLNKKYLWNCYLRWFAYAKYVEENGTCIWSDFDVMNCNLTPDQFDSKNIIVDSAFNGSLCSGVLSSGGSKVLLENIKLLNDEDEDVVLKLNTFLHERVDKDINDMIVLMALNTFKINNICTCLRIEGINQELSPFDINGLYKKEKFPLIHFHHGIFSSPNFLNFPNITSRNRADIVNYFFDRYLNDLIS